MMDDFKAYYCGFEDGAKGVLNLLRDLIANGFGWMDSIEAAEEWLDTVQRNASVCARPNDFFNQSHRQKEEE